MNFGDIGANTSIGNFPPAGNVVGDSDAMVRTNKRINLRSATLSNPANVTPASDNVDMVVISVLAQACGIHTPSGTPVEGGVLRIRILDSGSAQTLTFDSAYQGTTNIALPSASLGSTTISLVLTFMWDASLSKWMLMGKRS